MLIFSPKPVPYNQKQPRLMCSAGKKGSRTRRAGGDPGAAAPVPRHCTNIPKRSRGSKAAQPRDTRGTAGGDEQGLGQEVTRRGRGARTSLRGCNKPERLRQTLGKGLEQAALAEGLRQALPQRSPKPHPLRAAPHGAGQARSPGEDSGTEPANPRRPSPMNPARLMAAPGARRQRGRGRAALPACPARRAGAAGPAPWPRS